MVFGNLDSAYNVMQKLTAWLENYNEITSHKALKMKYPKQFLKMVKRYYRELGEKKIFIEFLERG